MLIPVLIFIYFLSRIYFINPGGVFFDSPEYLHLFALPNFIQALASGHHPLHIGYIAFSWPIFQLATFLHSNGAASVIFGQIILSIITLYCFYEFVTFVTDKRTARLATIFTALVPLYWIITDTIMMESAYLCYFFLSVYFLIKSITGKKMYLMYALSLFFLLLASMTHTMVIFWLPFLWYLVYYKKKKFFIIYSISSLIAVFLAYFLNIYFTVATSNISLSALLQAFSNEKDDIAILGFDSKSLFVILRDFFIIQMRNYTSLLVIISLISLIKLCKENKKLFILGLLMITPAIYINLWWDSLFPGRYATLSGFGVTFLAAYLMRNHKKLTLLVICYLLVVTLPAVNLLKKPIPYLIEATFAKSLPKDSLLIESHFSRPQVQQMYKGKLVAVNEHFLTNDDFERLINKYLQNKKPIFISSAALSDPYGLYTGPYLHVLSLSYQDQPAIEPVIKNYSLIKYKEISVSDNLAIYQIVSNKKSSYPKIDILKNSYRRIDYTDPLWQLTWWFETIFSHQ